MRDRNQGKFSGPWGIPWWFWGLILAILVIWGALTLMVGHW